MSQKVLNIVLTGGNSGIGYETAKDLYLRGHNIVFGSRNQAKNKEAVFAILSEENEGVQKSKSHFIKSFPLDLSKKESIERFSKQVKGVYKHIDILINNAGLMMNQLKRSEHQVEMTLATNHFGPFYLTYLLFPLIKSQPNARIINVSSALHYNAPNKTIQDIECKNKSFSSTDQYSISKFMNVLFTQELFNRISKYQNIKTFSLHPGIVDSNFGSDICFLKFIRTICCCFWIENAEGARTSIYLSTQDFSKLKNGEYYDSNTQLKEMDKRARDPKTQEDLWKTGEKLYGIKFEP